MPGCTVNKCMTLSIVLQMILLLCIPMQAAQAESSLNDKILQGGWFLYDPFQYEKIETNQYIKLTGFDIELQKLIANKSGYKIKFNNVSWQQHLKDIESGEKDIAGMALKTSEREKFATLYR